MNTTAIEIGNIAEQLLICLQADIENIEHNLAMLNDLRSAVVKRDEKSLGTLLDSIREQSEIYENHQKKRQQLLNLLAGAVNCPAEEMTLSRLKEFVNEDTASRIEQCRQKLTDSALKMKKEYASTMMMLTECSRINGRLLDTIFRNKTKDNVTYDATGSAKKPSGSAFVNLKL